ncbi:MAG: aminopeptidase [Clostridia bacterium]|nr:aminopeptidase [Clostridia bacterium]
MAKFDESLEFTNKNSWKTMSDETKAEVFAFCEGYKTFLDNSKTERESVDTAIELLTAAGFVDFEEILKDKAKAVPGTKLYYNYKNRSLFIAVLGNTAPENGFNLVGAHIDCPRLDLKPAPLFEDTNIAYLKTHYYGGIKKYHWLTIPLALHGVVIKKDGTTLKVCIGEKDSDPKFMISDLLPHLASNQMTKTAASFVDAEQMSVIIGTIPGKEPEDKDIDEKAFTVKQNILTYLAEEYGIDEKDFLRAELVIVPAAKACDIGLDRGLIASYGHDDRICAYTELRAIMDLEKTPEKTAVCYFADKEEIGSVGNTGARSNALEYFVSLLCSLYTDNDVMWLTKRCLNASRMLSADVTAAFDPSYPEVYDKSNAAFLGHGIAIEKYTGARGKSGTSDASAEFVYEVTECFDSENIAWQLNEMGKIEAGGGGTIAQFMADKGIEVIDCGVPLFNMHAPLELASKADIYWAYRAYKSFMK